ncbi:MAG: Unknown protein [uncultured Sulfurovum sp.]|uniref:Fe2OG dioxygenase domain-containing protein n=1 Tax=uncultured Sulfurovum sp. TaxID=269237 RepID=A0A6S6T7U0_9BACT|nr:MAG: Unknown protein [uncultured Sulfurovum sp.]
MIENFLTLEECHAMANTIKKQSNVRKAKVKTKVLDSIVLPSVVEEIRKTTLHTLPDLFETLYAERFLLHQKKIEDFFAMGLTHATPLQVLVYKKGDFYIKHADDSSELIDKEGNTVGFTCVAPERKITILLFGTSHTTQATYNNNNNNNELEEYTFEGGALVFNYLHDEHQQPIVIYPKAGDMLVFLSNPFFSHEVKPVTSGYRMVLAQWYNAL